MEARRSPAVRWEVAALLSLLLSFSCSASRGPGQAGAPTAPPRPFLPGSLVAEAVVAAVGVFDQPDRPEPSRWLPSPQPSGAPLVFLVEEDRGDWLGVLLPVRPNGSRGWIRRADAALSVHRFRIVVELGAHRITVTDGDGIYHQESVGVGARDTPTPGGLYYTTQLLRPTDAEGRPFPDGPYGPFAYALSGFSEVLYNFEGGEGVIGIHGTNEPDSLGGDTSYGCIRMSNDGITRLSGTLPVGVPVEIRA